MNLVNLAVFKTISLAGDYPELEQELYQVVGNADIEQIQAFIEKLDRLSQEKEEKRQARKAKRQERKKAK